jgi:prepilin-type processing-associated H-X9-DG protein
MEQEALANQYVYTTAFHAAPNNALIRSILSIYYCPSETNQRSFVVPGDNRARMNYVVCIGHGTRSRTTDRIGAPYYQIYVNSPSHPFHGTMWRGAMFAPSAEVGLADIKDGLSNTMCMSEAFISLRNEDWSWRGDVFNDGAVPYYSTYLSTPNSNIADYMHQLNGGGGNLWNPTSVCCATCKPAPCDNNTGNTNCQDDNQTARSYHPGGVNVSMGDGSGTFVNNSISWKVWSEMGSGWAMGKSTLPLSFQ